MGLEGQEDYRSGRWVELERENRDEGLAMSQQNRSDGTN